MARDAGTETDPFRERTTYFRRGTLTQTIRALSIRNQCIFSCQMSRALIGFPTPTACPSGSRKTVHALLQRLQGKLVLGGTAAFGLELVYNRRFAFAPLTLLCCASRACPAC